jgi:F-box domain
MEMENADAAMVADINWLPQECLSHVISLTSPLDACVCSAVSRAFQSAADSDATWQCFLPPDYIPILAQAVSPVEYASKKELYFQLCDHPTLISAGLMVILSLIPLLVRLENVYFFVSHLILIKVSFHYNCITGLFVEF